MNYRDIKKLRLFEALEKDQTQSQRTLSKKLNISLGLVNAVIKQFANKGYFKVTTISRNRIKYILTPKGSAEKIRLTYIYMKHVFRTYQEFRGKSYEVLNEFQKNGVKKIVIFGTNELAEIVYLSLQETHLHLVAVAEQNKTKNKFLKFNVLSPEALKSIAFDKLIVTSVDNIQSIRNCLKEVGINKSKIIYMN